MVSVHSQIILFLLFLPYGAMLFPGFLFPHNKVLDNHLSVPGSNDATRHYHFFSHQTPLAAVCKTSKPKKKKTVES